MISTNAPLNSTTSVNLNGTFYRGFRTKRRDGQLVYGVEEQQCIEGTVQALLSQDTLAKPGMLLGKIQSGKTKTFLGIIALAFDSGFDISVILTKPTTALAKQTYKRVGKDFAEFIEADEAKIYDILELPDRLTHFELNQKLIFVVKKQTDNLTRLAEAFLRTYPQLGQRQILLVDDEADNASIGYSNDPNLGLQLRRIAGQVDQLRHDLPRSSFLQVTATPYSLYLQPEDVPLPGASLSPVRPRFTKLVPVHPDYVGGQFYFESARIQGDPASFVFSPVPHDELEVLKSEDRRRFKVEECLVSPKVAGLRKALINFITAGCLRRIQDEQTQRRPKRFAFLFHTESSKAAHAWQESVILRFDEVLQHEATNGSDLLRGLVMGSYEDLSRSILATSLSLPAFTEVWDRVQSALSGGELMITKVNSEAQVASLLDDDGQLRLRTPLNIFIGGQILDRGITIANLIGFYYGRDPQKFQQDTVLQHSRMYGFRPPEDRAVTRFYTAFHIHRAMERMHEADSALRARIENQGDQCVTFIELQGGNIVPCSPTKTLASNIITLRDHRRFLPMGFQTDYKTRLQLVTAAVDARVRALGAYPADSSNLPPIEITIQDAKELLDLIAPTFAEFEPGYEDTWNVGEYKAILGHLSESANSPGSRGSVFLLVRIGRNRARPTDDSEISRDTPDHPQTDTLVARNAAVDLPVLMLLRQEGAEAQRWRGCPFWWPVIMTPANTRTTLFAHSR